MRTSYAPAHDGDPDPGEIVWTWVPFEENDGRGKDRPVLVVAREEAAHCSPYTSPASRTTRPGVGPIGAGPWDREGRDSWVESRPGAAGARGRDAARGLRTRPGAVRRVVERLRERYGWS